MLIETLDITDLHPDPANARRHPARNLDAITASLARFGQQKPIVIDANNVVRAGNGTLAAAKSLGWTTLQCVRTELTNTDAAAFAIVDNRTAELAEWDPDVLAAALVQPDIGDLGFDPAEIDALLKRDAEALSASPPDPTPVGESFQVIVDCASEDDQRELYDRLTQEGRSCRLLTL